MVRLTFYGGVDEIGGNKVLLEDGNTRIWLDFGMSFSRYGRFFEEYMGPRTKTGLRDYLALGLVPDVDGLYAPDLLQMADRSPQDPAYDAVLISHPHDDHVKFVSFLHPDIPVHMSKTCLRVRERLEEIGIGTVDNRICSYRPRNPDTGKPKGATIHRPIQAFEPGESFTVGNVEVLPMAVDHSIPGAVGFIVRTSAGSIVYSGDLRFHGRHRQWTEAFLDQAALENPVALITEGTRVDDTSMASENEEGVQATITEEARATDGLVVVDYAFKDADRFQTLLQVAEETGRQLVVGTKPAALYDAYSEIPSVGTPPMSDPRIGIHTKQKTSPYKWEQPYYDAPNALTAEQIGAHPERYLLGLNQWALNELIDIAPENALYVRSLSEPFNEEMALDEERVDHWIDFYGMRKIRAHCSGHAPGDDLLRFVHGVGAETVFPIHTEHPEAFADVPGNVVRVEAGVPYEL